MPKIPPHLGLDRPIVVKLSCDVMQKDTTTHPLVYEARMRVDELLAVKYCSAKSNHEDADRRSVARLKRNKKLRYTEVRSCKLVNAFVCAFTKHCRF